MLVIIGLSAMIRVHGGELAEPLFQFCVMGLHLNQIAVFIKIYGSCFPRKRNDIFYYMFQLLLCLSLFIISKLFCTSFILAIPFSEQLPSVLKIIVYS